MVLAFERVVGGTTNERVTNAQRTVSTATRRNKKGVEI